MVTYPWYRLRSLRSLRLVPASCLVAAPWGCGRGSPLGWRPRSLRGSGRGRVVVSVWGVGSVCACGDRVRTVGARRRGCVWVPCLGVQGGGVARG